METFLLFELLASPWEAIEVVAVAVFFANLITVCLPNKVDNKVGQFLIDKLNALSMNIYRNANRLYPKRYPIPKKKKPQAKRKKPPVVGGRDD